MEYGRFARICAQIYKTVETRFSFEDCMKVFAMFFDCYRDFTGKDHPIPSSYKQIAAIMEKMPSVQDGDREFDLEPEDYEKMIPAYFLIDFPGCDYHISHFFAGNIRLYRYYEICD